jgi:hypothetical protein
VTKKLGERSKKEVAVTQLTPLMVNSFVAQIRKQAKKILIYLLTNKTYKLFTLFEGLVI